MGSKGKMETQADTEHLSKYMHVSSVTVFCLYPVKKFFMFALMDPTNIFVLERFPM